MSGLKFFSALIILYLVLGNSSVQAQVPTTLNDFFLPGSQPLQSGAFNSLPNSCGCHGGYDLAVEPVYTWKGSMMSQSQRDPLYLAALTIANQDAAFSGDLCIRCHSPRGWLSGRSVPTDGSALTVDDREGVYCDFCHRAVKPSQPGVNPYPLNTEYTLNTYPADQTYIASLSLPNNLPDSSANGMYLIDSDETRRGPYTESDAQATHAERYSPFHWDVLICATCHDVSNPAYSKGPDGRYILNNLNSPAPDFNPYEMFPVERTFSEWLMSEYNSPTGVYAPQFGGNKDYVSTCQDCHMRDLTGKGCNKQQAPVRTDLGLHDMTGGNTFIPSLLPSIYGGEVNAAALDSGIARAEYMLKHAAEMEFTGGAVILPDDSIEIRLKVTNNTAHKLPSGYPEGRRIWLNVKAYDTLDSLIFESGAYDSLTGILTYDNQVKIYEIKPGLSESTAAALGKPSGPSFHFVLNDTIYKDNRIPPRGFTNTNFAAIQSPPVSYSYADGQYWDETVYKLPPEAARYTATLFYQTVSKEYVEFLRDSNTTDNRGITMYNLWNTHGKSAPVEMKTINGTVSITGFQLSYTVDNGWNLISFPGIHPNSMAADTLYRFRDLSADVFLFDGTGYNSADTLNNGRGYWLKHSGQRTYNWNGTVQNGILYPRLIYAVVDSFNGQTGWNLIGVYDYEVASSALTTNPPGIITGSVYIYIPGVGYQIASIMEPGKGYWIQLSAGGKIILPGRGAVIPKVRREEPGDFGKIVISDAEGKQFTLYSVGRENLNPEFSLPPKPPSGIFDVRFTSNRMAEDISSDKEIEITGALYPVKIKVYGTDLKVKDAVTGELLNLKIRDGQEISVANTDIRKLIVSGELQSLEYALQQNYPNPFNPSTTIMYSLGSPGKVQLEILDILGKRVALLVNEHQDEGLHSVEFNASEISSGIYFYRIRSGSFIQTKKMIVLQ